MNIEIVEGDPRQRREDVASVIEAREHAAIIAEQVRNKLERYINLEIFSTEKDDHTRSLSERVTVLEGELGEMRQTLTQFYQQREWEKNHPRRWWQWKAYP